MDNNLIDFVSFVYNQRECNKFDPRHDLDSDHEYWQLVLKEADKLDHTLYGILHGYRCVGTRLIKEDGRLKLKKRREWEKYWVDDKEYKVESHKNLLPYRNLIKEILKRALHQNEQLALF